MELNRREFLRSLVVGAGVLCLPGLVSAQRRSSVEPLAPSAGRGYYYTEPEKRLIRAFMDIEKDLRITGPRLQLLEMAERGDISQHVLFDVPWKGLVNTVALPQISLAVRLVSVDKTRTMKELDELRHAMSHFYVVALPIDVSDEELTKMLKLAYRYAATIHHPRSYTASRIKGELAIWGDKLCEVV